MPLNNNHRVSPSTLAANEKIAVKLAAFSAQQVTIKTESPQSHDDITIEEIGPCDEEGETSGGFFTGHSMVWPFSGQFCRTI